MASAAVTSKGQITIPASVRNALGVQAGSRIEFVETTKGEFNIVLANSRVQELKGMLRKPDSPVTIENMNETIAARGATAA